MEMHQIRYFLAVARTLNFTRAAEECHVAQPSLTRAIKNLEEELGGELFRRERAGSHLTNLGRTMLPLLARSYESATAAKSQAESFKKGDRAVLRVALSETVDFDLVADAFRELRRAFADIQLSCERAAAPDIVERLRTGESEIAIAGSLRDGWDRLDSWPLFDERFCVVVNDDHQWAQLALIEAGDLAAERIIMRPFCEQSAECAVLLERAGVDVAHCHEVASDRDAVRLVEAGLGVGLFPMSVRTGEGLKKIEFGGSFGRTVEIHTVAGRLKSPILSGLTNLLRSTDWARYEAGAAVH